MRAYEYRKRVAVALAALMLGAIAGFVAFVATMNVVTARPSLSRPSPHTLAPFRVVARHSGRDITFVASAAGGCEQLEPSSLLHGACSLALNVNGAVIASSGYGAVRTGSAPFLALVWRARLAGDPAVCEQNGLDGETRLACRTQATAPTYSWSDAGVAVIDLRPPSP